MRAFAAYFDLKCARRKVFVTTGEDNKPARNLYEKIGLRLVAVLPDLFAKGESELAYVLTLGL